MDFLGSPSHQKQLTIRKDIMVIKLLFFLLFFELYNTRPGVLIGGGKLPLLRTGTAGTSNFNPGQRVGSGNVEENATQRCCYTDCRRTLLVRKRSGWRCVITEERLNPEESILSFLKRL